VDGVGPTSGVDDVKLSGFFGTGLDVDEREGRSGGPRVRRGENVRTFGEIKLLFGERKNGGDPARNR